MSSNSKNRKAGRNAKKCQKYSAACHAERNKVRRIKKHLKQSASLDGVCRDECAKSALVIALRAHSGK